MAKYNPFNTIKIEVPGTNTFDLSFDNKLTLDIGKLYPVLVQETLPGDYFDITPEMLIRFAPLTFPIMHRIDATIHFFYCPNRIVWTPWEKFLAGEDVLPPTISGTVGENLIINKSSFFDYIGLPLSMNLMEPISFLPFLAIYHIHNEYYQDQNNDPDYIMIRDRLQVLAADAGGRISPADIWDVPGAQYSSLDALPKRAWEHDYFTSALPFAQKGDAVNIPLSLVNLEGETLIYEDIDFTSELGLSGPISGDGGLLSTNVGGTPTLSKLRGTTIIEGAGAELSGTINQLRVAMQLQKFLEKNARSGTRYNELIRAHFGEDIGDARISRPEYIGGIKNNIVISEVLQTSQTSDDSSLGDYSGHATGVVGGNNIRYKCSEHGFIIGLLSVIPKTAYFQGIDKKFSRQSYLDYYWKEFAQIGEQAILKKEVYYTNTDALNNDTFGYIPRYSEYKNNRSEVHGDFRTTMLDFHLARNFASRPVLNEEFIYVNDDKRIFAVTDEETNSLYAHIYFDIQAKRKIPFFTNPGGL